MVAGGRGWFLFYTSSRNTDCYQCPIAFETEMMMKKKIHSPFLYATEKPLIKEHLHFTLSFPEKTIHLERVTGKQIPQKEMKFHSKTHLPKMTRLGCFNYFLMPEKNKICFP